MFAKDKKPEKVSATLFIKQYLENEDDRLIIEVEDTQSREEMENKLIDFGVDCQDWKVDPVKGNTCFKGPVHNRGRDVKCHSELIDATPLSWALFVRIKQRLASWLWLVKKGQVILKYHLEKNEPQRLMAESVQKAAQDFFGSMFRLDFESLGDFPILVGLVSVEVEGNYLKITFSVE